MLIVSLVAIFGFLIIGALYSAIRNAQGPVLLLQSLALLLVLLSEDKLLPVFLWAATFVSWLIIVERQNRKSVA